MRIAVFIKKTTNHVGFGGMEVQNKLLCEGLCERGHDVVVFSPKADSDLTMLTANNVKYIFVDGKYRYFLSKFNKDSWYTKSLAAFSKEHTQSKFDLVISQSSAGLAIIAQKKNLGVKVVAIAHGSAWGEFRTYFINNHSLANFFRIFVRLQYAVRQIVGRQRIFICNADKVVAVSSVVKKQIVFETGVRPKSVDVIHNGIVPFDVNTVLPMRVKKLIYIGQVSRDKGVDLFLRILHDFRFKDYEIDIIGDGDLLKEFKIETTKNDNILKINLIGKITREQIIARLSQERGSIFVFPTNRVEGLPMVLIEAMFAALPVVTYDIGGNSDAVQDEKTGYLVKFKNENDLISKLLDLSLDTTKITKMGQNARQFALSEFRLDTMIGKYEALFQDIIKT